MDNSFFNRPAARPTRGLISRTGSIWDIRTKISLPVALLSCAVAGCAMPGGFSGTAPQAATAPVELTYADAAGLALAAPIIVDMNVQRAIPLDSARAPNLPANVTRYYAESTVNTLLRGEGGVPPQINFLVDRPTGQVLRRGRYIAFAAPVSGRPGTIRLVRPESLIAWTPQNDAATRAATREAVAINAPPPIASVGQAFHFPGQVEGEGETQIFLETESGDPVSLRIVSTPGESRKWGISLGEVVATDLSPPPQPSLLWYRLACGGLPDRLPRQSIASPQSEEKVRSDYQFVRAELGACARNLR